MIEEMPKFLRLTKEQRAEDWEKFKQHVREYIEVTQDRRLYNLKGFDKYKAVQDDLGGLMAGQILFTSDPNRGVVLFCAWWPWGNGEKISIRVGLWSKNLSDAEYAENLQQLKVCFGL